MTDRLRKTVATLWLLGMMISLATLSGGMPWRLGAVFFTLLALLAWGRRIWKPFQRLEPPLLLILLLGIVLAVFGQTSDAVFLLEGWTGLLLVVGTLIVTTGLLFLGWKRPVGGIVDLSVFLFCLLFPLAVLFFQLFVHHYFKAFSVEVGVRGLACEMLAAFSVYVVLSQFILQDPAFRFQLRPIWKGVFCLLILAGTFRFMALGKNLLVLRQLEFEPGETLDRAVQEARQLDARLAWRTIATRAAKYEYDHGDAEPAVHILEAPLQTWRNDRHMRLSLQRATDSSALATFLLGAEAVNEASPAMVALAVDSLRGRLFFVDEKARIFIRAKETLQPAGQVARVPEYGPVRDLLWWETGQRLLLLFDNGSLAALEVEPRGLSPWGDSAINIINWTHRPHTMRARSLVAVGKTGCVVIGYGDFEIQPALGELPPGLALEGRELRPGEDLLRDLCFLDSGQGGYLLDAYGGVHPLGKTPIRYENLQNHRYEKAHYWPGQDKARAIGCSGDGSAVAVFDTYGGIHYMEKQDIDGKVRYFGSTRAYFDRPVVADVVPAYDSYYLLHTNGRVDRRTGLKQMVERFHPKQESRSAEVSALLGIFLLGWIQLRSARRVPRRSE